MLNFNDDIIAAAATPQGTGALSIIRISGENCFAIVDKIFKGKNNLYSAKTHTIHYGKIYSKDDQLIDDVLVSVFRNPNSFTGEDSVEISTHGSQLINQKILETLVGLDVRLAEPGEFTKRAFLNGKMDLAQAEAVVDVINSRTEASLKGARNQLDGLLSKKVDFLREQLVNTSSLVELELDFAEEDVEFIRLDAVKEKIKNIIDEIEELLKTYSFGRVIRDGVNVAIVGKPNVGKSSLLNYFLKESRAIVSEIPGTTRDIIREELSIDGILFRLFDTAGIRLTEDVIEKEGVLRSRRAVSDADLVIFMNDFESGFADEIYSELKSLSAEERIITIFNKVDLQKDRIQKSDANISALTGEGIDSLLKLLKKKAVGTETYSEKTAIISNIRHFNALEKANSNLLNAIESIDNIMSGEFIAVDLRNAEQALGEIIGKVTTDDILNNIFEKFCIGK
jgi:tRNA modification GTPase